MDLTERQIKILKAIIEEYIGTALPVGSETLEKKYSLAVSPATIRNEMVALVEKGFLKKPHASAGRVPTPLALKYYVRNLLQTDNLPVAEEVSVKQQVWDHRHEFEKLLQEATKTLAQKSKTLAVSTSNEGNLYYAGTGNILDFPEFFDIDLAKGILSLLDRFDYWNSFSRRTISNDPFYLVVGNELGEELFEPCSFLYTRFHNGNHEGMIGIVGPSRLNYSRNIPLVKYFGELLNSLV